METTTKLFHFRACARTSLQKVECEVNCIRIHVCIVCVSPITEREIMQRFLHHEFFPLINLPTWSVVVIHCNRITTSCFRLPIDKQTTNCSTLANRITIKRNVTFFFSITIKRHVAINHQYRRKAIALSSSLIAKSFRYKSKFTFVSTKISSSLWAGEKYSRAKPEDHKDTSKRVRKRWYATNAWCLSSIGRRDIFISRGTLPANRSFFNRNVSWVTRF